jgi:hypothetical protein
MCSAFEASVEKLGFPHSIVAIRFSPDAFLVLDFNEERFLCVFSCVHNGWRLSAGDVLLVDQV